MVSRRGSFASAVINVDNCSMSELLTEAETAAYLRVKKETLRKWRWQNRGPKYVRVQGRIVYRREDLEKFVEHNTVTTQ